MKEATKAELKEVFSLKRPDHLEVIFSTFGWSFYGLFKKKSF